MLGVLVLSLRLLAGVFAVGWLRRSRLPVPAEVAQSAARLTKSLGMRFTPGIFTSERVREATVVGLVRPMVLVPAA